MRNKLTVAILSAATLSTPALANDLNINGFLSVGASMASDDTVTFEGHDTTGGFKSDTILGLQVSKQVNDSTSVTGQLVSRGGEDYSTEAAWAFVTYAATDNLDLRLGRIRTPLFFYSDFLEVGYAYDWVRPPLEVYSPNASAFSSLDGTDLNYRFSTGTFDHNVQLYYGRNNRSNTSGLDAKHFSGIALTSSNDSLTLRASAHQVELHLADNPPAGSFGAGVSLLALAGPDFAIEGENHYFYEAGFSYDNGEINLVAEYTHFDGKNPAFMDSDAYLVKVAKRFGEFTPHLTYSSVATSKDSGANGNIQEIAGLEDEQTSITAGLRYDYDSSTALKFEVQQHTEDKVAGVPGEIDETAMLYSIAVDVVF